MGAEDLVWRDLAQLFEDIFLTKELRERDFAAARPIDICNRLFGAFLLLFVSILPRGSAEKRMETHGKVRNVRFTNFLVPPCKGTGPSQCFVQLIQH